MTESAAVSEYRQITGNFLLARDVGRPTGFLRRNLRVALDAHRRRNRLSPDHADMIAHQRSSAGWDYPTREMLDDLTLGHRPILQLDALQIRHPASDTSIARRARPRPPPSVAAAADDDRRDTAALDWLPHPDAEDPVPCHVQVNVRGPRADDRRTVFWDSCAATLSHVSLPDDPHPLFEIFLAKPFRIELEKLFVATASGRDGVRWKKTVAARYVLDISIQCLDPDDTADFLARLEHADVDRYSNLSEADTMLCATWDHLPSCPGPDVLLPLRRTHGRRQQVPEHQLELSMGWSRRRASVLTRYNQALASVRNPSRQLPTPSTPECGSTTAKTSPEACGVIIYRFREPDGLTVRQRTVEGSACVICDDPHPDFARLMLHYSTHHDHFRFDVDEAASSAHTPTGAFRRHLTIGLAEKPRERPVTEEGPDVRENWIAPSRPFNIDAHLRGEDDWTGSNLNKRVGHRKRSRASQLPPGTGVTTTRNTHDTDSPTPRPGPPAPPTTTRPSPSSVPALPPPLRRHHPVPPVPGVTFYRAVSKRPLPAGALISDSDDDIDDAWLARRQRLALPDAGLVARAPRAFALAWNRHLAREHPASSLLLRDALVRFARAERASLRADPAWRREWSAKLRQLRAVALLDDATLRFCANGAVPPAPPPTAHPTPPENGDDAVEGAAVTNGTDSPAPPSPPPAPPRCSCGEPLKYPDALACENLVRPPPPPPLSHPPKRKPNPRATRPATPPVSATARAAYARTAAPWPVIAL